MSIHVYSLGEGVTSEFLLILNDSTRVLSKKKRVLLSGACSLKLDRVDIRGFQAIVMPKVQSTT